MKLALVVHRFPSVSETFIYNHAAGLRAAGLDVTVIATRTSNDAALFADFAGRRYDGPVVHTPLKRAPGETAARTASFVARRTGRGFALWNAARKRYGATRRAARAWLLALPFDGFDLVHFEYSGLAASWLDALPLLAPARLVVSCRGAAEQIKPLVEPARVDALRAVFARCDRVHCVSEDMQRTCEGYGLDPAKAFVNRPAIDARRFSRSAPYVARPAGPYRLLSTGRLHWKKGLDYAISAVRLLVDAGLDVHYEILGAGVEEERLRFAVHDLGLEGRVTFSGRRSSAEVKAALEKADVYLLPSLSEGLSNAALEAMAMELPVVSTGAGGMAEAIDDGVHGLLVASRDPRAMADRVAALLHDPTRRTALGRAGRRRIEEAFSLERQIETFVHQYQALMRESPRGGHP